MSEQRTYLDHNATAPLRPEAARAMSQAMHRCGNASSVHREGRTAHAVIETARAQLAALVNADAAGVVFTSGGTEANNLALGGVIGAEGVTRILLAGIEHPSVLEAAATMGVPVRHIAVTSGGVIDLDDLRLALGDGEGRAVVCAMLANNETGAVQPVGEVVRLAREHDALVHTDAVQAVAKIETDFRALGVDMMALSGHKIGGPLGSGALILRDGVKLDPRIRGGGQELKRRAGTENVPAIAGFGAAARCAADGLAGNEAVGRL
ncbi:MAG: cysteine desulfurase family protein, partial [Hyphomicrobiales bacterium]